MLDPFATYLDKGREIIPSGTGSAKGRATARYTPDQDIQQALSKVLFLLNNMQKHSPHPPPPHVWTKSSKGGAHYPVDQLQQAIRGNPDGNNQHPGVVPPFRLSGSTRRRCLKCSRCVAFVYKQRTQHTQDDRQETLVPGRQVTEIEPRDREKRRRWGFEAAILRWYQEILREPQHHQ